MISQEEQTNQKDSMYSIFTVLYCHTMADESQSYLLKSTDIAPHNQPERVELCRADLESGDLKVEIFPRVKTQSDFSSIPCQYGSNSAYFRTSSPFDDDLRGRFESGNSIYIYSNSDDEMPEYSISTIFSVNRSFPNESLHGWSDSLRIERVESFADLVRLTFQRVYLEIVEYDPCFKRRYNQLKGLTEAIFQGKSDGEEAQFFHSHFPSPACRRPIIDLLWSRYGSGMEKLRKRFIEVGLE